MRAAIHAQCKGSWLHGTLSVIVFSVAELARHCSSSGYGKSTQVQSCTSGCQTLRAGYLQCSLVLGVVTFTLAMCVGTLVVSIGIEPMLLFMFRSVVIMVPDGVRRMAVMLTLMGMPLRSGRGPYPGRGLADGDG